MAAHAPLTCSVYKRTSWFTVLDNSIASAHQSSVFMYVNSCISDPAVGYLLFNDDYSRDARFNRIQLSCYI